MPGCGIERACNFLGKEQYGDLMSFVAARATMVALKLPLGLADHGAEDFLRRRWCGTPQHCPSC